MIIVGLGNPGKEYEKTRHNVGFMFVDELAKTYNLEFKLDKKLQCMKTEVLIKGEKHIIIKPITYMNLSGNSVRSVVDYYKKTADDVIVIYDDMDLDLAKVRIRKNGSSGGHNGIKSIIACLNTENFKRIRIGIGPHPQDAIDYVLGKFSKKDQATLDNVLLKAPNMIEDLINKGMDYLMNNYNG